MFFRLTRYFFAHRSIVIFKPYHKKYESRIIKVYELIRKKWKNTYLLDIDDIKHKRNYVDKVCSQAKVIIFDSEMQSPVLDFYKKYIDYFTYEGIYKEGKLIKLRFKNKANIDIVKNTLIDYFESQVYNREIHSIVSFVRLTGRENFIRRLLEAFIKGKPFTFLSPTTLFKLMYMLFSFLFNKAAFFIDKVCGKIFSNITLFFVRLFYLTKPIDNKKIVFIACHHQFNCNPKYIALHMLQNFPAMKVVWIVQRHKYTDINEFPLRVKLIANNSLRAFFHLSTAKIFIVNSLISKTIPPRRKGQYLIQTWHGSLGIKRFDKAWNETIANYNNLQTSFCISNSQLENEVYSSTYWKNVPTKMLGHARNDILFQDSYEIKKKVCHKLGIPQDYSIVLYAPTFREQDRAKNGKCSLHSLDYYNIDYERLCEALKNKFGGKWVLIERFHFHLKKFDKFANKSNSFVYNASAYPDIQELMAAANIGITDYSSWIYDFMLTRRPGFLFITDINDYQDQRGLYYPIETTPFPIAENNDKLIDNIYNFNEQEYIKSVDDFLLEKGCMDDGYACERIGKVISDIINKNSL